MHAEYFYGAIASHIESQEAKFMTPPAPNNSRFEPNDVQKLKHDFPTDGRNFFEEFKDGFEDNFRRHDRNPSLNQEAFKDGFEGIEYENIPVPDARRSVKVLCSRSPSQNAPPIQHMPWDYNSEIMSTDEYIDSSKVNAKTWDLTNETSTNISTAEAGNEKRTRALQSMSPSRVPVPPPRRQNLNAPIQQPRAAVPLAQHSTRPQQSQIHPQHSQNHPQQSQIHQRNHLHSNPSAASSERAALVQQLLMKWYWAGYRAGCTEP